MKRARVNVKSDLYDLHSVKGVVSVDGYMVRDDDENDIPFKKMYVSDVPVEVLFVRVWTPCGFLDPGQSFRARMHTRHHWLQGWMKRLDKSLIRLLGMMNRRLMLTLLGIWENIEHGYNVGSVRVCVKHAGHVHFKFEN